MDTLWTATILRNIGAMFGALQSLPDQLLFGLHNLILFCRLCLLYIPGTFTFSCSQRLEHSHDYV